MDMPETVIEISELRGKDDETIKDLVKFLEDRTKGEANAAGGQIILSYTEEAEAPSRSYMRVLLRKFLHKEELKGLFRVIAGKESAFIIKAIKQQRYPSE